MKTFAAGFIAGGIVLNVVPTVVAVVLSERNLRREGLSEWARRVRGAG